MSECQCQKTDIRRGRVTRTDIGVSPLGNGRLRTREGRIAMGDRRGAGRVQAGDFRLASDPLTGLRFAVSGVWAWRRSAETLGNLDRAVGQGLITGPSVNPPARGAPVERTHLTHLVREPGNGVRRSPGERDPDRPPPRPPGRPPCQPTGLTGSDEVKPQNVAQAPERGEADGDDQVGHWGCLMRSNGLSTFRGVG